ncbi:hypothetical protein CO612_09585, partial [Lysobacteraceae bacterium NML71-0210]
MVVIAGLIAAESTQARRQVLDRVVVRGDRGSWGWDFLWDFGIYYAHGIREPDYYLDFPDLGEYDPDYQQPAWIDFDSKAPDPDDCGDIAATAGRNILIGNPVVVATGNKVEYELEFQLAGEMGLGLMRVYNHHWPGTGIFGRQWVSSFDYFLTFGPNGNTPSACFPMAGGNCSFSDNHEVIFAWRPSGGILKFEKNAATGNFTEASSSFPATLTRLPDGSFRLESLGGVEEYHADGRAKRLSDPRSIAWNYSYNGNRLARVTHTSGQYVEFVWSGNRLQMVRDPAGNTYQYGYTGSATAAPRLVSATTPGQPARTTTYHYESNNYWALTGKSINGVRHSRFSYHANGLVASTEHNGMQKHRFVYSNPHPDQFHIEHTNPLGKRSTWVYTNGKLTSFHGHASPHCAATTSAIDYDANGYPSSALDSNGNRTTYQYNAQGQLLEKIEGHGTAVARKTTYQWDNKNRLISVTLSGAPAGTPWRRNHYSYTVDGRIARIERTNLSGNGLAGNSHVTLFSYSQHANGMLASITMDGPLAGNADRVISLYDSHGNLLSVENSLGHKTTYSAHNALGLPGRMTTPNGGKIDYIYDAQGRLIQTKTYLDGGTQTIQYHYDNQGRLSATTTPDNLTTQYTYGSADRSLLTHIRRPSAALSGFASKAEEIHLQYAASGDLVRFNKNRITEEPGLGPCIPPPGEINCVINPDDPLPPFIEQALPEFSSRWQLDELGRIRAMPGNNGQNFQTKYDANGNIHQTIDSAGQITQYTYDALNRLVSVTNPQNGITRFEYNLADQLTQVTDPRGNITTYTYDGLGQIWAQSSPDTGQTQFQYNAAGQLIQMTRQSGILTQYAYDALGRLTHKTAGGHTHHFTYDTCPNGKGLLCQITDPSGTMSFAYSPEGLLTHKTQALTGSGINFGQHYTYDNMGRLAGIHYPGNIAVAYGYTDGKITTMTVKIGNAQPRHVLSNIQYQAFGPALDWQYGNGLTRNAQLDLDGRLTQLNTRNGSTGVQTLAYQYNSNNLITRITHSQQPGATQHYSYDTLGRLTHVSAGIGNQSFAWDAVGNRISHTNNTGPASLGYANNSNHLQWLSRPLYPER